MKSGLALVAVALLPGVGVVDGQPVVYYRVSRLAPPDSRRQL